jgi:acetyl esterase/lipase
MLYEQFSREEINPNLPESQTNIRLRSYARPNRELVGDKSGRWAVLILPGGGYGMTAPTEAEPVALSFLNAGIQSFVLDYSVSPDRFPLALLETAACIDFIRRNAAKYGVRQVAVCGFSAGGHLAGCMANLWNLPLLGETLGLLPGAMWPDAAILCYPVITSRDTFKSSKSFTNLLGDDAEIPQILSLEQSVSPSNPPTFVWCTFNDNSVPMENSLLYANALRANDVPCELHIYSDGPHAMGLCTPDGAIDEAHVNPHAATWHGLCVDWLKGLR